MSCSGHSLRIGGILNPRLTVPHSTRVYVWSIVALRHLVAATSDRVGQKDIF